MTAHDAIVVGGGVAGITAAIHLAAHDRKPLLLETRRKLGGRATSFTDPRSGLVIDNCQHVALGCCTNYLDLCARLGVDDRIRWEHTIHWVEPGGRTSDMRPGLLPPPSHFLASLWTARFLALADKLAVSRAMTAAMRTDRRTTAHLTFAQWLEPHAQTRAAIDLFWTPIIVSAANLTVDRVAASVALHVIQEGFLATRSSALMGVPSVPLVELYDPAVEAIKKAGGGGGGVRLGTGVASIEPGAVTTTAGERIESDLVICALPVERARKVLADSFHAQDDRLTRMGDVRHSPILGVHLVFDRPVMPVSNAVLVGRDTQWLFRKDDEGRAIHAVISAADDWLPLSESEIASRVLADVHACFPDSSGAATTSVRAVKEKLATFAATPEFEASRPSTTGPGGIILAGDYVQTGWPATMEGAARSGAMAAAAALDLPTDAFLKPAMRPAPILRVIGARGLRDQDRLTLGA